MKTLVRCILLGKKVPCHIRDSNSAISGSLLTNQNFMECHKRFWTLFRFFLLEEIIISRFHISFGKRTYFFNKITRESSLELLVSHDFHVNPQVLYIPHGIFIYLWGKQHHDRILRVFIVLNHPQDLNMISWGIPECRMHTLAIPTLNINRI